MKNSILFAILLSFVSCSASALEPVGESNGIPYPEGWQNWPTIAVSHRTDNNTMRVILGNEIAVKAARSGQTNPWPDGAILGKVVWKASELADWPAAKAPGQLVHAEFMFKNATGYQETGGWGWARWLGLDSKPFNEGMTACVACHTPVAHRDWVFSDPAMLSPMTAQEVLPDSE